MSSGTDVTIADDYAELESTVGKFYFGYASAQEDDDYEWRFTYTTPNGEVLCSLTLEDLEIEDEFGYDDVAAVLLYGVGYCFEQGLIKQGDI